MRRALLVVVFLLALSLLPLGVKAAPGGVSGVWLAPDWILPGTRSYTEDEVRRIARQTLERLAAEGVNTVFLETWLRGYSIAPGIQTANYRAAVQPFRPGIEGLPVYRHLRWDYRVLADEVQDPLQIFIDEARPRRCSPGEPLPVA